jgi:hypothetical protein
MKLVFIYGAAASGKLTVARELAALTGLAVFHNHLIVDAVGSVFPFGSDRFIRLREVFWLAMFREAAEAGQSIIFTFAPEATVAPDFPHRARKTIEAFGGELIIVRLTLPVDEQERRIGNAGRSEFGKAPLSGTTAPASRPVYRMRDSDAFSRLDDRHIARGTYHRGSHDRQHLRPLIRMVPVATLTPRSSCSGVKEGEPGKPRGFIRTKGMEHPNPTQHQVESRFNTLFQRDYAVHAADMRRLYENAKRDQWNAASDIDWTAPVDLEAGIFADGLIDGYGSEFWDKLDGSTRRRLNLEFSCWRLSQFLHGEEGAMLACSQLVDMVPTNDAKFFQSTQVVDEARHTEVLSRYLTEKCGGRIYPIADNLRLLFDQLLGEGKWFIKTVGLQLIAETFAVGMFRMLAETAQDPLLRSICQRIVADESRHMGFSVLGLPDVIRGLDGAELRELEDFTVEACRLVMRGMFPRAAFEAAGFSEQRIAEVKRIRAEAARTNDYVYFRTVFKREMYTQVTGNLKKVGLMTPRIADQLRTLGFDPEVDGRSRNLAANSP